MKTNVISGLLLTMLVFRVSAQNYSIDWFTIDGGGGTSSGGGYTLSGTIGQPDASAPMSGGSYSLTGGFWSVLAAVPTPGAPVLTIFLTSTNTAVVSWPSPSTGYVLQQSAGLASPDWITPPESANDDGTNRFIIVTPPLGNRFYRLTHP
jgi:hypothetical protein